MRTAAPQSASRDTGPAGGYSASDLTARARIRDAAISCFASSGFATPFRVIAARADVSPGLITHHFGSKSALRAECDSEVLRRYSQAKHDSIAQPSASLLAGLTAPGGNATVLVYMLRVIHDGGAPANDFLERLIDDMRVVMAEGVATGLVRPSRDEEARLRLLTYQSLGALLVQLLITDGFGAGALDAEAFVASLSRTGSQLVLPTLELYTEGVMSSDDMLANYLAYLWEPPDGSPAPATT